MSFSVNFYTSSADPRTLDKTSYLTALGTAQTISSKHEIDILNPVFTINYDSTLLNANYCYIETFNRYYYCTISTDTAQKIIVKCTVDPLHTYHTAIKNVPVTVVRSESIGPTYVIDNKLPIDPNNFATQGLNFTGIDYTGDGHNYILVLAKGGGN